MADKNEQSSTLTRKELYDLIWSKPFTTLAKEYKYSDNGLRKICKKHNIPTPNAGHWAKIRHGKPSPVKSLPKGENAMIDLDIREEENRLTHSNSQLAKIKNDLQNSDLNFQVPDRLNNPHPLVKKAKEVLKNQEPGWYGKGRDVIYSRGECLATEVTKDNIPRALRLWDTLIKLILQRGHKVSENKDSEFLIFDEKFSIRIREILKRVKVEDSRWERFEMASSGIMSIKVGHGYEGKEWRDQKNKALEDQVISVLAKLEQLAHKKKKERIEREAYWKKKEEEKAAELAQKERTDTELNDFKQLLKDTSRWHTTQSIRKFIAEYEGQLIQTNSLDTEAKDYISWAQEKADWYDPFIEKEVEILKDIDRETLERKRKW